MAKATKLNSWRKFSCYSMPSETKTAVYAECSCRAGPEQLFMSSFHVEFRRSNVEIEFERHHTGRKLQRKHCTHRHQQVCFVLDQNKLAGACECFLFKIECYISEWTLIITPSGLGLIAAGSSGLQAWCDHAEFCRYDRIVNAKCSCSKGQTLPKSWLSVWAPIVPSGLGMIADPSGLQAWWICNHAESFRYDSDCIVGVVYV